MTVRIVVATHKPCEMPSDPMYLPLQVGAAGKTSIGFPRDDTGENISLKNANYCELTGLYWAWKHLDDDYIGLVHYRRLFSLHPGVHKASAALSFSEAERLLTSVPVILPKKRFYVIETMRSHYLHSHRAEGLSVLEEVLRESSAEYAEAFNRVMAGRSGHMFNMCIMRKDIFRHYCSWLFPILEETERRLDLSGYSASEARVFGYLSEFLIDVFFSVNPVPYREIPVLYTEPQKRFRKGLRFLRRKFFPSREIR